MGLKKVNKKSHNEKKRVKGSSERRHVVLSIVYTDSSFTLTEHTDSSWSWLGKCIHCNSAVTVSLDGDTSHTIEHIYPKSKGGAIIDPRNLAMACERCNNRKGVRHDKDVGKGGRADEVVAALQEKRRKLWRDSP